MGPILGALAPIFLLIVLGWALRAARFLPDAFWLPAEKLTYFILFPSLLVSSLAEASLAGQPVAEMVAVHGGGLLVMAGLAALLARRAAGAPLHLDAPGFSSLFQGLFRPNTYVGLAAAAGLFGPSGLKLTAICVAVVVPLANLVSVLGLVHWCRPVGGAGPGWRDRLMPVLTNPLIIACLLGIGLNLGGIGLPPVVGPLLKILGQASLPMGLLAVGAGLDPSTLRSSGRAVAVATLGKLALLPLLVGVAAWLLGVRGTALAVTVAYAALPVAPNSYVLARQLGGDARLMSAIITASTLLAAATLPAWLLLAGGVP
ncbi:AEC family transporter [Magnetospirillum sp. UT-4]|uniref:AEC family transporter n=1 Tax=Magnetospirillum sp. UT-4 TaxID=2681467 RepID=UPI0013801076|nr:AEC family transporter [Magnetospirillum sp. UT-4]CAA7620737.1 putative auxin efflux carrier [Magnetospirillum sp. UT-4]